MSTVFTPAATPNNGTLIDPGLEKIFNDEYNQLQTMYDKVLKVENMSQNYVDFGGYTGLSLIPTVNEGEAYTDDAPIPTFTTRFTATKKGLTIPVTYELYKDQFTKVAGDVKSAAKAVQRTIEKEAASIFNNAYDTAYTSYGDNKPLISTDHTRADGGTSFSNASATGITLTDANLETAILAMRDTVDDRGNLLEVVPDVLLVPPALEKEAIIITGSDKRSGTANNDANVYNMTEYTGGKLKVLVWNYLGASAGGSDTAWFLIDSRQHQIRWMFRERPSVKMLPEAVGAKNDVYYWKVSYRRAYGWTNPRGIWGSKGDGLTYSS